MNTLLSRSATPVLTWAAITGASQYEVQLATDQKFGAGDVVADATGLATPTYTPSTLTSPQKYFWRFRALLSTTRYADQTNATGAAAGNALRDAAGRTYLGQGFTTGTGQPLARAALALKKTGTPTGNIWAEIWTSNGGSPVALTGAASANVDVSTLTGSYVTYNFDFATPVVLQPGTLYFLVLRGDFAVSGANYAQWQVDAAGSYTGGAAFKADATPTWTTNGVPDQIFTTYYYRWGTWSPMRSFFVNTSALASYTPSGNVWAYVDPDDPTDYYEFPVAPNYDVQSLNMRRAHATNIRGDMLSEYTSTRDAVSTIFDGAAGASSGQAYIGYAQMAEMLRFFFKRKSVYLVGVTDYLDDVQERIWKVDFTQDPTIVPIAAGRNDYFVATFKHQEAALT